MLLPVTKKGERNWGWGKLVPLEWSPHFILLPNHEVYLILDPMVLCCYAAGTKTT